MKKILTLILALAMLCTVWVFPVAAEEGVAFESTVTYTMDKPFSNVPLTMEATILLPENGETYALGGTIVGNYSKFLSVDHQTFGVHSSGNPRITYNDDNRSNEIITFTKVNILSDQWTHLTLVLDPALKQAHCYVNGELKETVSDLEFSTNVAIDAPSFVGGDPRENNTNFFRGRIKNVTLYSDVRTA
ncbi:MAG: LamG domain-containing protein, partial [Clostridia bacterium]|nr:LamG domain-containing protein [Clostridia bacterium]